MDMELESEKIRNSRAERDVIICSECGKEIGTPEKGTGTTHGICSECVRSRAEGDASHSVRVEARAEAGLKERETAFSGAISLLINRIEASLSSNGDALAPAEGALQALITEHGKVINKLLRQDGVEITTSSTKEDLRRISRLLVEKIAQHNEILPSGQ